MQAYKKVGIAQTLFCKVTVHACDLLLLLLLQKAGCKAKKAAYDKVRGRACSLLHVLRVDRVLVFRYDARL